MSISINGKKANPYIGGKAISSIVKNGEYIYRHANDKFRQLILKNSVFHEGSPDFSQPATTDEGLWAMEDDYGMSYYFRGAVENNYVKFGGFYWRIIRINGDGSVRIIYDGTKAHANGESSTNRFINKGFWNSNNNDNKYVGYMYGGANGAKSTSKEQAQTNETNSRIKTVVDDWYKANIYDKDLDKYVADAIFCNDRSITYGDGFSLFLTEYCPYTRFSVNKSTSIPQFICPQKNDAFTVLDTIKGNGALTYKVGLITADEVVAAGGKGGTVNKNYYLRRGYDYWSLSPSNSSKSYVSMLKIAGDGSVNTVDIYSSLYLVPVINLKADAKVTGTGTMIDPYRLENETL